MIRIAALNDSGSSSSSSGSTDGVNGSAILTKEALEHAAYSLYNKCLGYERAGLLDKAAQSFEDLLKNEFISEASSTTSETGQLLPSALLKYSALKNLAKVYSRQDKHQQALTALLQAIEIDFTDVTVCYRLGVLSLKLNHLLLACRAFKRGLELSANHWPCLDNLITLLYTLDNYEGCLCYIAQSLERDAGYVKGLVLRKAIFKEQPCLEKQFLPVFSKCNLDEITEYSQALDSTDELEILQQVEKLRDRHREACKPKELPTIDLNLSEYSWSSLGKRLLDIYQYIEEQSPDLNHSCKLIMSFKQPSASVTTAETLLPSRELVDNKKKLESVLNPSATLRAGSDNSLPSIITSTSESDQNSKDIPNMAMLSATSDMDTSNPEQVLATESTKHTPADDITNLMHDILDRVSEDIQLSVVQSTVRDLVTQVADNLSSTEIVQMILNELLEEVVAHKLQKDTTCLLLDDSATDHQHTRQPESSDSDRAKKTTSALTAERKRRSARVKLTTAKQTTVAEEKKQDKVDHISELERIISDLLQDDSSQLTNHSVAEDNDRTSAVRNVVPTSADEEKDVKLFLLNLKSNRGVVHVMREWIYTLCERRSHSWCTELKEAFINVYEKHINSYQRPSIFSSSDVEKDALAVLIWLELYVDEFSTENTNALRSSHAQIFNEEFVYWSMVVGNNSKLPNICDEYSIRYHYMLAQYYSATQQSDMALKSLNFLLGFMGRDTGVGIFLPNSKAKTTVDYKTVKEELNFIERALSLKDLQTVFDNKGYPQIVKLLSLTFDVDLKKRFSDSRYFQLDILIKTVANLEDRVECFQWLAKALQEVVHYVNVGRHGNWSTLVCDAMSLFVDRLDTQSTTDCLPVTKAEIVRSCLTIIKLNINSLESSGRMLINTVSAWILLSILTHGAKEVEASPTRTSSNEFPHYIQVLLMAHSLLAKYSLCTSSDGQLLQYTVQKLQEHKQSSECNNPQLTEQLVNQCIYCLYGHPNKKIRAKSLTDHNSPLAPISWSVAQQLFSLYKPKSVPEYDSYKSSTISAELEHLVKRLVALVPAHCQPDSRVESAVYSYLTDSGTLESVDQREKQQPNSLCKDGFYLLADYYFKNKEPLKAIKHYVQDLYYQPDRFDSWAGMALAKSSKLESRLNLMERQSYDGAFQKLAVSTMQSFKRALHLVHDNVKLWIEYACAAYQLHSFASRVMKTKKLELSSTEMSTFTELKGDMLERSRLCYIEAGRCNDDDFEEEWLQHYMLGKICEKSKGDPEVYLDHYTKAASCLHKEGAQYPSKISYMYNPPYLAVEALEIYYRIHATILKSLQRNPPTHHFQLYTKVILEMKESPFAAAQVSTQPPSSRKRKSDGQTLRRRKSEIDMSFSVDSGASITTRRKEKLKLDAEIVSEIIEKLVSTVARQSCEIAASVTSSADERHGLNVEQNNLAEKDIEVVMEEILEQLNSNRVNTSVSDVSLSVGPVTASSPKEKSFRLSEVAKCNKKVPFQREEISEYENDSSQVLDRTSSPTLPLADDENDFSISTQLMDFSQESLLKSANFGVKTRFPRSDDVEAECMTLDNSAEAVREDVSHQSAAEECVEDMLSKLETFEDSAVVVESSVGQGSTSKNKQLSEPTERVPAASSTKFGDTSVIRTETEAQVGLIEQGSDLLNEKISSAVLKAKPMDEMDPQTFNIADVMKCERKKDYSCHMLPADEKTKDDICHMASADEKTKDDICHKPSADEKKKDDTCHKPSADEKKKDDTCHLLSAVERKKDDTCHMASADEKKKDDTCHIVSADEKKKDGTCHLPSADEKKKDDTCHTVSTGEERIIGSSNSSTERENDSTEKCADHTDVATSDKAESVNQEKLNEISVVLTKDELIDSCIQALKVCILRYPLHYKSYFRLGKTFLHDKQRKDLDKVQELLLGNTSKKKEEKYVPQGLFQDRKHNNFFNGVWRNPVEEIERAGSFGSHLHKTIYLLLQFLHEKRDYHLLYQLHTQLQRTPEQEKKFLKDVDRLTLSSKAMEFAIHSLYKVVYVFMSLSIISNTRYSMIS
ncbi:cabin1 [Bugula neritina]|uniref:Cabin1 n=1 Tax=Bugula neritina TaxID=10212 RepID=A0A7J7JWB5_BUGNE|nr:cabin1 [Bugula neritina]